MELISDLSKETWTDKGNPPVDPSKIQKYRRYSVFRRHIQEEENNNVIYYLKGDDGEPMKVVLPGVNTRRDPLKDVHNAYLKLEKQGEECVIKGIMLDTDWVEIKSED